MTIELAASFDQALRRLNWVQTHSPSDRPPDPSSLPCPTTSFSSSQCWLHVCSELNTSNTPTKPYLNRVGRAHIQRLLSAGWTLRSSWPRHWSPSIEHWLGCRLFLGHASLFAANTRMISLVSSRMGRHGNQQPHWAHWLDGALRYAHRHDARLLIIPETTLAPTVEHFARLADLPHATARWTTQGTPSDWLCDVLSGLATSDTQSQSLVTSATKVSDSIFWINATPDSLFISPAENDLSGQFQALPLQDRLSLALADSVLVFTMRSTGNLEKLVTQRLQDPLFPSGSLFVTLLDVFATQAKASSLSRTIPRAPSSAPISNPPAVQTDWLKRGAVGWVACRTSLTTRCPLHHCRSAAEPLWLDTPPSVFNAHDRPLWQLSSPLPAHWQQLGADDNWPYLVHCTRGTLGPFPDESVESFRERVWLHGDAVALHPLETLARICREQRLRATCGITRTGGPCVSFSAVPLVPLLRRRTFQAHLGRWDWEPYGLLIHHQRLLEAGAAQVIYGTQESFLKLPIEKKPLFQPSQRKREKSNKASWTAEREWRVLHNVDLHLLPVDSILVFTRTRTQAQQLAQYAPWPVLWTEPK